MKSSILLAVIVFGLSAVSIFPQNASLWIEKCSADASTCHTQEIVRYDFVNGKLAGSETVISLPTDDIRFDIDGGRILFNRFLVSGSGDVIELKTKEILHRGQGDLLTIRGRKLITVVNSTDAEGIFSFDLDTREYKKLRGLKNWPDLEADHISPDGKFAVEGGGVSLLKNGGFINFFTVDEKFRLKRFKSVRGNFEAYCSERCSSTPILPYIWIDNTRVLTQETNGKIVTVSTSGVIEKIAEIPVEDAPDSLPHFSVDEYGNYSYYIDGDDYFIDLVKKTASKTRIPLGEGFSRTDGDVFWREFFYDGNSIGKIWSGSSMVSKHYLAVQYAAEGKNLGYPDGIKVWNTITREWTTIEISWFADFIRWSQ